MTDVFSQQIAEAQARIAALQAQQVQASVVLASTKVGDIVEYAREEYVGRVDIYPATVRALHADGSADLTVVYPPSGSITCDNVRFDPDGRPSSWKPQASA